MLKYLSGLILIFLFLPTFAFSADLNGLYPPMEIEAELLEPPKVKGMVFVKGGCFDMGDTFGDGDSDERPVHEVCVDDFYLGKYEVTVGEFREFVHDTDYRTAAEKKGGCYYWTGEKWEKGTDRYWLDPGFRQTERNPVACVSWYDTQAYIKWRSKKQGRKYRLPTEAEWEFAARSRGKKEKWAGTSSRSRLGEYAWYRGNSDGRTHPVGQKKPNALGLYDMSGNVWEWVGDWYVEHYYRKSPRNNPKGPSSGKYRALRGGSWDINPVNVRAAFRRRDNPVNRDNLIGFRLSLPPQD